MTAGVDFKKLKEVKDLSYLAGWYCPVEKVRMSAGAAEAEGSAPTFCRYRYSPSHMPGKMQPSVALKRVMAGF